MHSVGFEIATFGPFVPAVDVEDARPGRVGLGEQPLLGQLQRGAEVLRRVVANGVGEGIAGIVERVTLVAARARIPTHADVREKGHIEHLEIGLQPWLPLVLTTP